MSTQAQGHPKKSILSPKS